MYQIIATTTDENGNVTPNGNAEARKIMMYASRLINNPMQEST